MTIQTMLGLLATSFLTTLMIFCVVLVGSLLLGFVIYFGRVSRFKIIRAIIEVYISVMRGTPLMLQLMVVYYGPNLLLHISVASNWRILAVLVAFIINYAAYFCEIYRSGISSIPHGQYEAAEVLGYNRVQTFLKIILPQMVKRVIPPVTNEVITLVKDTSLASVIGVVEMFTKAKQIAVAPNSPGMLTFAAAAVFYYVFNYVVAFAMGRIEKALNYYS